MSAKKPREEPNDVARRDPQPASAHEGRRGEARVTEDRLELRESYYAGPLPSPEDLERYAQVHPDAVPLILGHFNEQGIHRRALEAAVVTGSERRAGRGQFVGAFLLGLAIVGGCIVAATGAEAAGAAIAGAALGAGALVYVVGGKPGQPEE